MFNLFNTKNKGIINIQDVKQVFSEFLDMQITDNDINEFLFDND